MVFDLGNALELSLESRLETVGRLFGHRAHRVAGAFHPKTRFISEEDLPIALGGSMSDGVRDVFVRGYFQSRAYLEQVQGNGDLLWLHPRLLQDQAIPLLNHLEEADSFAVHIRRGDYLKSSISGALPAAYYVEALRKLGARRESSIFVFSDSPQTAKEELEELHSEFTFQFVPDDLDSANSLYALSKSSNLVMSNSTFSWWGAMTGNLGKRVCHPAGWNEHLMHSDWESVRV